MAVEETTPSGRWQPHLARAGIGRPWAVRARACVPVRGV